MGIVNWFIYKDRLKYKFFCIKDKVVYLVFGWVVDFKYVFIILL